jgi:hypothetical protein
MMVFNQVFFLQYGNSDQWIGGDGPTSWPAPPPDLNSLDIYPWGHLKSTVNATGVSIVQGLQQRTQNGSGMIRTTSGIFLLIRQWLLRCATCVESQGGHFWLFL